MGKPKEKKPLPEKQYKGWFKALHQGKLKDLQKTWDKFVVDVNVVDEDGHSSLQIAAICGHTPLVTWIAGLPGVNLDYQDRQGITAVLHAVLEQKEAAAFELIKLGADPDIRSYQDVGVFERADVLLSRSSSQKMRAERSLQRGLQNSAAPIPSSVSAAPSTAATSTPPRPDAPAGAQTALRTESVSSDAGSLPHAPQPASADDLSEEPTEAAPVPTPSGGGGGGVYVNRSFVEEEVELDLAPPEPEPAPVVVAAPAPTVAKPVAAPVTAPAPAPVPAPVVAAHSSPAERAIPLPDVSAPNRAAEVTPESSLADAEDKLCVADVAETVLDLAALALSLEYTEELVQQITLALKPLSVALKSMFQAAKTNFSGASADFNAQLMVASQRVSDAVRGITPAVRKLSDTGRSSESVHEFRAAVHKYANAVYGLFLVGGRRQRSGVLQQSLDDLAQASKMVMALSISRQGGEGAFVAAVATLSSVAVSMAVSTAEITSDFFTRRNVAYQVVDSGIVISRAIEGLLISGKGLYANPADAAAKGNLLQLGKVAAERFHRHADLAGNRAASVAVVPEQPLASVVEMSLKQLAALVVRFRLVSKGSIRGVEMLSNFESALSSLGALKTAADAADYHGVASAAQPFSLALLRAAAMVNNTRLSSADSAAAARLGSVVSALRYIAAYLRLSVASWVFQSGAVGDEIGAICAVRVAVVLLCLAAEGSLY